MDNNDKIKICQYYSGKVKEETEAIKELIKRIPSAIANESLVQRAACWSALMTYIQNRGFNSESIRKIIKPETSGLGATGFEQTIFFLETKFDEANKKQEQPCQS